MTGSQKQFPNHGFGQAFGRLNGSNSTRGGGIIAALSSIVVLAVGVVLGSFLLIAGLVVAVGIIIAFLVWRFFFMRKLKKQAEAYAKEFNDGSSDAFSQSQRASGGSTGGSSAGAGPIIDGDYKDVTKRD